MWPGFREEDFVAFRHPDIDFRVDYIKNDLHPRLRELGKLLRSFFMREMNIELRSQLRSGRWFKWPYWTNVSLVSLEEEDRSDSKRPRLSVFIDDKRVIVGFCQNIWSKAWKQVSENKSALSEVVDSTISKSKLRVGIFHWIEWNEAANAEVYLYPDADTAIKEADRLHQDFIFVGQCYQWPGRKKRLCSAGFLDAAKETLYGTWPVYEYVFNQKLMRNLWV